MRVGLTAIVAVLVTASWAQALTTTTVSYQQNVNGYTGVTEIRISDILASELSISPRPTNTRDGTNGNVVTNYLIDGFATDDPLTPATEADSREEQELIRFDGIIGVGQIPAGATILDAKLTYKTAGTDGSTTDTAVSPGPWGVAGLNQAFTTATRFTDFPSDANLPLQPYRGAWFQDHNPATNQPYATRSVGAFSGYATTPPTGTRVGGGVTDADVWPIVQSWADGTPNHGFAVLAGHTGQTNGWGFYTSGSTTAANRPKLSVTYTTDPISKKTFQRGDINGYDGNTIIRMDSGADLAGGGDDVTIDATALDGAYYIDGDTSSHGVLNSIMKFGGIFGAGANQAPSNKPVAKAWLVLTTGVNDDHRSPGPFSVYPMLRDWDTDTASPAKPSTYSEFGAVAGLTQADGDIGAVLDQNLGATNGGESWFDITSYLEGVRNGGADFGLAILPDTGDGWAIQMGGSADVSVRPRIVVYSELSSTPAGVPGDYNNNGTVDAADYILWRNGGPLQNEVDTPGTINLADYDAWRARFGNVAGSGALAGGAVPEPASVMLLLMAIVGVATASRNR